jgi:predicted Rossmann-fold nucleotide-binding protein
MIHEHFMRSEHVEIWQFVDQPEDIIPAIGNAPKWDSSAIKFAAV